MSIRHGALLLLSILLAIGYLVTRPHLGTVYIETFQLFNAQAVAVGAPNQLDEFPTKALCDEDARRHQEIEDNGRAAAATTGVAPPPTTTIYACKSSLRMLWGW